MMEERNRKNGKSLLNMLLTVFLISKPAAKEENNYNKQDLTSVNGPPCKSKRVRKLRNIPTRMRTYQLDHKLRYEEKIYRADHEIVNHYTERDLKKQQIVLTRFLKHKEDSFIPNNELAIPAGYVDALKIMEENKILKGNQIDNDEELAGPIDIPQSLEECFSNFEFNFNSKSQKKSFFSRIFKI